jgi:hypothetical protein
VTDKTVITIFVPAQGMAESEDSNDYAQCMESLGELQSSARFSISEEGRIEVTGEWPTMIEDMFTLSYWYEYLVFNVYEAGHEPLPRMFYFVAGQVQVAATIVVFEDFNQESLIAQEDFDEEAYDE